MSPTKFAYVVPGHANTNSPGPAGAPTFSGAELGVAGGSRQTNVQERDDEHRHARTLRRGVEDPPGLVIGRAARRGGGGGGAPEAGGRGPGGGGGGGGGGGKGRGGKESGGRTKDQVPRTTPL